MLNDLHALDVMGNKATRQVRDEVLRYFGNQVHRMDYPTYLANGWQIGSDPVESVCKTVIGERMKGGGMRWGCNGTDAMSLLRAHFCSTDKQWDGFWSMN